MKRRSDDEGGEIEQGGDGGGSAATHPATGLTLHARIAACLRIDNEQMEGREHVFMFRPYKQQQE